MKYSWIWIVVCILSLQASQLKEVYSEDYDLLEWTFEPELDGSVHVEVKVTTSQSSSTYYFSFSKDQPVENLTAQEVETGNPITIREIQESNAVRYSFDFGSNKDEGFQFLVKFDRLNEVVKTGDDIYFFDWEWEGANQHVVTVILPENCEVVSTDSEYPVNISSQMGRASIAIKTSGLRSVFSFGVEFQSLADEDGDGVVNGEDECYNPGCTKVDSQGCPKDSDNDGVIDCDDECPNEKGSSANDGCPVPVGDNDNDGVTDDKDRCDNPGCTIVDSQGCPQDTDSDGVIDCDDECPAEAGPLDNGCPDEDNDGISDSEDLCYNPGCTAVDSQGCPQDTDSDGVIDCEDNCLHEAGPQKNNGCPSALTNEVLVLITLTVISVPITIFLFIRRKKQKLKTKSIYGDDTIMYDDETATYDDHTRIY